MKKKLLLSLIFAVSCLTFGQRKALDSIFNTFSGKENITTINISKSMFSLVDGATNDKNLAKIKPLLKDVKNIKIIIITNDSNSVSELEKSIKKINYENLMSLDSQDGKVDFFAQKTNDEYLQDVLLRAGQKDQSVILLLDGKIKVEDISSLIEQATTKQNSSANSNTVVEKNDSKTKNNSGEEIRNVSAFNKISVSSGIGVTYTQDKNQLVKIETDPDKLEYIATKVENGTLKIYIDSPIKNLRFKKIAVYVSSPHLEKLSMESGAAVKIEKLDEKNFTLDAGSGAAFNGNLNIKEKTILDVSSGAAVSINLETNSLMVDASSGMAATLKGKANTVTFDISSGAVCNAINLEAKNATADVSSGAILKVHATENLAVDASSGASIHYKGNPKLKLANEPKFYSLKKVD